MPRRTLVVLLLSGTTLGVSSARGQRTAPAAAPSDTIARLAVDPAKNPGVPFVTLLDETRYVVEADGRLVQHVRQVTQVLDPAAARALSERALSYAASHQSLRLQWTRVLRVAGGVVSDKPAQEQESGVPAAMANPVYQDQKVRRFSLAGVEAGTVIDLAWTMEERAPPRAGDFFMRWAVNGGFPVARSRLTLDAPESLEPRIVERNLNFRRRAEVVNGRRITTWAADGLAPVRNERYAADSNGVIMTISIGPPSVWSDVARWYNDLARDRYTLAGDDAARIDAVVRKAGARTRTDTIRAVHRYVAQDIRYLSVALGIGGYQPHTPAQTIATATGDCKDKATLFVAALRRYGIAANPVLLAIAGRPDRAMPTIFQFNHAIAAVREGNSWAYTDLTAELIPYGELPVSFQGSFGIVVLPDGRADEVRFPDAPVATNTVTTRVAVLLDTTGRAVVHIDETGTGSLALQARAAFAAPIDGERRETLLRNLAARAFPSGATADSLIAFDGRDLTATPRIRYRIVGTNTLKTVSDLRLFSLNPVLQAPGRFYSATAREIEAAPPRQFPIEMAALAPAGVSITDVQITLPAGWTAELPKNVTASQLGVSYQSTWSIQGNVVRLVRRIEGTRGILPPQRIVELIVWLKTVGTDDYDFLSLRPAPVR